MDSSDLLSEPILFEPNRVWRCYLGGKLLDKFTGQGSGQDTHFPEDWLASTTVACNGINQQSLTEGLVRIKAGSQVGPFFNELLKAYPDKALGKSSFNESEGLGVLCKYLDSAIRLPIQCHPDIPFARKHFNSDHGKTESWFILDTRVIDGVEPYILLGFKPDVSEENFKNAVRQQNIKVIEQMLHRVKVLPGEMYFIPARMPHAIGSGVLLLEVQEPTDWVVQPEEFIGDTQLSKTDMWGPLTPEIGLNCFDYKGRGTLESILSKVKLSPTKARKIGGAVLEQIIGPGITPCFNVSRLTLGNEKMSFEHNDPWYIAVVVNGNCKIAGKSSVLNASKGQYFFISKASGIVSFEPTSPETRLYIISKER